MLTFFYILNDTLGCFVNRSKTNLNVTLKHCMRYHTNLT